MCLKPMENQLFEVSRGCVCYLDGLLGSWSRFANEILVSVCEVVVVLTSIFRCPEVGLDFSLLRCPEVRSDFSFVGVQRLD